MSNNIPFYDEITSDNIPYLDEINTENSNLKYDNAFEEFEKRKEFGNFSDSSYLNEFDNRNDSNINSIIADRQPWSHQFGNALGRLTNIIPEAVGGLAAALDFEDYVNSDDEVGNWLSALMDEWKETTNEALPIYRRNPGEALDFSDSGWWFDNGSSLVNSIGGFAISGGIISKSLQGLAKLSKVSKLANIIAGKDVAGIVGNIANTTINATMLNQAEAIMEATDVYNATYEFQLNKLNKSFSDNPDLPGQREENEAIARQIAADAASLTIKANRANILLNLSSANLFLKSPFGTRTLLNKASKRVSLIRGGLEGLQESGEEVINLIAGDIGKAYGQDKDYSVESVLKNMNTAEAYEAALLGFVGGIGQTFITEQGVNRIQKIKDPETGEKISLYQHKKNQYDKQQKELAQLDEYAEAADVSTFTTQFKSIEDSRKIDEAYKKAVEAKDEVEVERLQKLHIANLAVNAFKNGTTTRLIKLFEDLKKGPQKEGMEANYKEKADEAVDIIKNLEKEYNRSSEYANMGEIFHNRAQYHTLNKELNKALDNEANKKSDLQNAIDIIFKRYNKSKYHAQKNPNGTSSITVDQILSDDSIEGISKGQLTKLRNTVKRTPEFKEFSDELDQLHMDVLKTEIDNNEKEHHKLTSSKYQKDFIKQQEDKAEILKEQLKKEGELAELVEKVDNASTIEELEAISTDNPDFNEELSNRKDIVREKLKTAEKVANQAISTTSEATETEEANNAVESAQLVADNFNVGETINTSKLKLPREFENETEVTIKKISSNGEVTVKTKDGTSLILGASELVGSIDSEYTTESSDGESENFTTQNNSVKNIYEEANQPRIIITNNTSEGKKLEWIDPLALDFEREPGDKRGKGKNIEVNKDHSGGKDSNWQKALDMFNTNDFSDINFLINHLPLNIKLSDNTIAGIETQPKGDQAVFNKTSKELRTAIIKELAAGNNISSMQIKIGGQSNGQIQIEKGNPENNINNLYDFKNKKVKSSDIYIVGAHKVLENANDEFLATNRELAKGEVYIKIKMANGRDFPLKLNIKKVSSDEASILYDLYKYRLQDQEAGKGFLLQNLPEELQKEIKDKFAKQLDLFKSNKQPYKELSVKDLVDFIIWDGTKNPKSQIRLYANKLLFGIESLSLDEMESEINKDDFIKFVTEHKRHQVKFKPRKNESENALTIQNPKYLNYLLDNKILNTNAKVNEHTFQGKTTMYIDKRSLTVNGKPSDYSLNIPKTFRKNLIGSRAILRNLAPGLASQSLILKDDETGYVDSKTGKEFDRVSHLKEGIIDSSKPNIYNASKRGDIVDLLIRDYFSSIFMSKKDFIRKGSAHANNINKLKPNSKLEFGEDFYNELYNILEQYKEDFNRRGYTIFSQSPTLGGKINNKNYAGTMDLLAYDNKNGDWIIIDVKTSNSDRGLDYKGKDTYKYKEKDAIQQNAYARLFEQVTGRKPSKLLILPLIVKADSKGHTTYSTVTKSKAGDYLVVDNSKNIDELKGFKKETQSNSSQKDVAANILNQSVSNDNININTISGIPGADLSMFGIPQQKSKPKVKPLIKEIDISKKSDIEYELNAEERAELISELQNGNVITFLNNNVTYMFTKKGNFVFNTSTNKYIKNPYNAFKLIQNYNKGLGAMLQINESNYKKVWKARLNSVILQNNKEIKKETVVQVKMNELDFSKINENKATELARTLSLKYRTYIKDMVNVAKKVNSNSKTVNIDKLKAMTEFLIDKGISKEEIKTNCKI